MVLQKSMSNDDLDNTSVKKREFTPLDLGKNDTINDTISYKEEKSPRKDKDALKIKYQQRL